MPPVMPPRLRADPLSAGWLLACRQDRDDPVHSGQSIPFASSSYCGPKAAPCQGHATLHWSFAQSTRATTGSKIRSTIWICQS